MRLLVGALAGAVLLASSGVARADVLYNSIDPSDVGGSSPNYFPVAINDDGGGPLAASFSTGSQGVALTEVQLVLYLSGVVSDDDGVGVYLVSSPNGQAGPPFNTVPDYLTQIGTVSDGSIANDVVNLVTFDLTTPYALTANTTYWIELGSDPAGAGETAISWDVGSGVGDPNQQYWSYNDGSPVTGPNSDLGGALELSVSAVPEPTALALFAGFLPMIFLARRRKQA